MPSAKTKIKGIKLGEVVTEVLSYNMDTIKIYAMAFNFSMSQARRLFDQKGLYVYDGKSWVRPDRYDVFFKGDKLRWGKTRFIELGNPFKKVYETKNLKIASSPKFL